MTTSVFTELLSSYDGLRKRTWTPHILEEGQPFGGIYRQLFGKGAWEGINIAGPEYKQMLMGIKSAISAATGGEVIPSDQWAQKSPTMKPGEVIGIQGGGIGVVGAGTNSSIFSQKTIPTVLQAIEFYLKQTDEEEDTLNKKKNDDKLDKEIEGDVAQDVKDKEAAAEEKAANAAALEKAEQVKATEPQTTNLKVMWKKEGMSEEEQDAALARLEKTINTPHKGTKIYKGLVETMGSRPDLPAKVKQEAFNCVAALASVTKKVVTVSLADGTRVQTLYEADLGEDEIQALRVTTIRGEGGSGGVYMGKGDIERQSHFSNLQDFTSDYDHSKYGTTFGSALGDSLGPLWGVRMLPVGVDAASISDKAEYDEATSHSTRQSGAIERRGTGAKSLSNDWKGKLTEDIVELNVAVLSGAKEAQATAIDQLRKRLEAGAEFTRADLDNLESVLLGDEFEGLLDFQRLDALGIPANVFVRQSILQAAVQTEVFFAKVGINSENVEAVERPSNKSLQGYKSDVDVILKPGTKVNSEWKDCVREDEHGRLVLSVSIKNYDQLRGNTVLGSSSLNKSYGVVKPGDKAAKSHREKANQLQEAHLNRAVEGGHMSEEDKASCLATREHDRVLRAGLEKKFGALTDPNLASLRSFMTTMLSPANEMQFDTIAEKIAYEKQLNEINGYLKSGHKGDSQMAAIKIWQLHRQARAQKDPEYAKAVAFNDAVFSAGTFDNEIIMRGSPGKVTSGKYHDIFNDAASALFSSGGTGAVIGGSSQIRNSQGNLILDTRITAKLTSEGSRKLMGECRLADEGRRQSTTTEDAVVREQTPLKEAVDRALENNLDEEEGEVLTGSTLYPILQNLPPKETGDIQRVGDKLIVTHLPFCLKVKHNGYEFEGGFPSKEKALKALDLIRLIAREQGETIVATVEDYDAGRTFS